MKEPLKDLVGYIQNSDFKNATSAITGISDEQNPAYDILLGVLARLFTTGTIEEGKILETAQKIQAIYDGNKGDTENLHARLNEFLAKYGKAEDVPLYEQELGNVSAFNDMQLKLMIENFKKKQQDLIKEGKGLDQNIGQKLSVLFEEQNKRSGYKAKDLLKDPNESTQEESAPKADEPPTEEEEAWFVTPSDKELESKENIYVACGSPITSVLRRRYELEYHLQKIPEVDQSPDHTISGEEEYTIKREKVRQKEFVSNYIDPSLVLDQDICAYEIASEILKDEYAKPSCIIIDANTFIYNFSDGYLNDVSDPRTGKHLFSMEKVISGHISICLHRKEAQSLRPIGDAYDILELYNGLPIFYFYSSKGVSALSEKMVKDIMLAVRRINNDLSVGAPATIGKELSATEMAEFINSYKAKNETIQSSSDAESSEKGATPMQASENAQAVDNNSLTSKSSDMSTSANSSNAVPKQDTKVMLEINVVDTQPAPVGSSESNKGSENATLKVKVTDINTSANSSNAVPTQDTKVMPKINVVDNQPKPVEASESKKGSENATLKVKVTDINTSANSSNAVPTQDTKVMPKINVVDNQPKPVEASESKKGSENATLKAKVNDMNTSANSSNAVPQQDTKVMLEINVVDNQPKPVGSSESNKGIENANLKAKVTDMNTSANSSNTVSQQDTKAQLVGNVMNMKPAAVQPSKNVKASDDSLSSKLADISVKANFVRALPTKDIMASLPSTNAVNKIPKQSQIKAKSSDGESLKKESEVAIIEPKETTEVSKPIPKKKPSEGSQRSQTSVTAIPMQELEKRVDSLEAISIKTIESVNNMNARLTKLEDSFDKLAQKKPASPDEDKKSLLKNRMKAIKESIDEKKEDNK